MKLPKYSKKFFKRFTPYLDVLFNLFTAFESNKFHPAKVVLVCHDNDRSFLFNGEKYSPLIDSINDRLKQEGVEVLAISLPYSNPLNRNYGYVVNVNGPIARATVLQKFLKYFGKKFHSYFCLKSYLWGIILDRVGPRVIIGINPPIELCMAAKSRGIWVADMQHGILSDEGYYGLMFRKNFAQEGWPSCILCWDLSSKKWIEENIGTKTSARLIGNPWFIRFINPLIYDELVSGFLEKKKQSRQSLKKILITLQWGPETFPQYHDTCMPIELFDFIKKCDIGIDWWIRLHPAMIQGNNCSAAFTKFQNEFGACTNVFWEDSTNLPLPVVLTKIDLHITVASAATIEAAWFGIKTALLGNAGINDEDLRKWFSREINYGIAEIVPLEKNTLRQWIEHQVGPHPDELRPFMSSQPLDDFLRDIKQYCFSTTLQKDDLNGLGQSSEGF
jgi:hypothetical protein